METAVAVSAQQLWLGGLALAGVALVAVALLTASRPAAPVPPLGEYFGRWRSVHGGYDPATGSVWVKGWLTAVYRVARPLARRGVRPDLLTMSSVWLALGVLTAAAAGGRWLMLAGWLVVCSGILDSLDGAVAVITDRATRWGYVLDSVADRVTDLCFVAAVVVAGAPPALGAACGAALFLLEYLRARGGNAGAGEIGVITVGERPSRVGLCALGLHFSGVFEASAAAIATAALAVLLGLTVIGLAQLTVAVRRQLSA